jgi:hypothetical protein
MNMPIWDPGWRFGGYLATIAIGAALFLVPAFRERSE